MKTTGEYAIDLVTKYFTILPDNVSMIDIVKCAIIDVENTIAAIDWHEFETPNKELEYYNEVLTILKSKL